MTNRNILINRVLERADSYKGFRSRANRVNDFGAGVRQNGKLWDGAFLETVFFEEKISPGTSLTSTAAALAFFTRTNRIYPVPRVGDIVFYAWSSDDDGFGQPHVGLVAEVRDYKKSSTFCAIEGMTNSGLPRGPQESDGVYRRVRFGTDVLAFARPLYGELTATVNVSDISVSRPVLKPSNFQPGKSSAGTVLLQLALHETVGAANLTRGVFDEQTASAVRAYQRLIGLLPATGTVDDLTLVRLARDTSYKHFVSKGFTPEP
jgi:hypothetical protein